MHFLDHGNKKRCEILTFLFAVSSRTKLLYHIVERRKVHLLLTKSSNSGGSVYVHKKNHRVRRAERREKRAEKSLIMEL